MAFNDGMITNYKLRGIWKEVITPYFEHLAGGIEKHHGKSQSW
jgi:hypothetical protein